MSDETNTTTEEIKPEQIEFKEQQPVTHQQASPENVAAQIFYLFTPKFKQAVHQLPLKACRRLLCALIEYPLQVKDYNHQTETEKNAFAWGDRLLEAKYTMILHTLFNKMEEEYNQSKETANPEGEKEDGQAKV